MAAARWRHLAAGQQPVFLAHGDRPDRVRHRIVVDGQITGVGRAYKGGPAPEQVITGFGQSVTRRCRLADRGQPLMQWLQGGEGMFASQGLSLCLRSCFGLRLDLPQACNPAEDVGRDRVALRGALVQIEEFPARMCPTGWLGYAGSKHGFVAAVISDHEPAAPAFEAGGGMLAAATGLVIEDDDRWSARQVIAAIRPEVSPFGFALARIELLGCFVSMQAGPLMPSLRESLRQRLQSKADAPAPFGQRATGKCHVLTRRNLFEPIKRQVIEVFAGRHPGQQARDRHAAINDCRIDRRCRHGFAGAAGIRPAEVANHEETGRFNVQRLAEVLANLDQR